MTQQVEQALGVVALIIRKAVSLPVNHETASAAYMLLKAAVEEKSEGEEEGGSLKSEGKALTPPLSPGAREQEKGPEGPYEEGRARGSGDPFQAYEEGPAVGSG